MFSKVFGLSKDQVSAAKYALEKRKMGYTLLRNPKGTSNTEVNMIKVMRCVSPDEFHDRSTFINKVTVNINDGETSIKNRWIHSTRFRDPKTKKLGKQRNVEYSVTDKNDDFEYSSRKLSESELAERKVPKWKERDDYHEYYSDKLLKETVNNPARAPYFMNPIAKAIMSVFSLGKAETPPAKPNFYSVLWDNLHNKG